MGGGKEHITRHFSEISSDRTRGDEHKLKCNKFCLNTRKKLFYSKGGQTLTEVA